MLTEEKIQDALEWAYGKAVNGILMSGSVEEFAREYRDKYSTVEESVDSLIKIQTQKNGASGFLTGLGGIATLPVTLPANLTNVLYVQLRMIAAIAVLGGHDPRSDEVQTKAYLCLVGTSGINIAKKAGIEIGKKAANGVIKKIPGKVLVEINKKVGFRLITKFGTKGLINLGKAIPVVGGIIGGTVDYSSTKIIGNTSKQVFIKI